MAPLTIGGFEVPWIDTVRPEDTTSMAPYKKQTRKTEVLPKGWKLAENTRALPCDIIYDQNIAIPLRDGVKIYCDVLRPVTDEKVPAIIGLSPYGKGGHGFKIYDNSPFRLGIRQDATSGLEKFEGADPAEWGPRGYAVVNVDVRGSWDSEGNLYIEGTQPGVDGYDVCEFIAALEWCTGGVTMAGNSWMATTQWATAIQKPPSLKCIAPWEGFTDKYRDVVCRGGIPKRDFVNFIFNKTIRGRQQREDLALALDKWPLMNGFWADKFLDTSVVDIPVYALGSYCSGIHVPGSIRGFNTVKTKDKWFRVHPTQEWYDLYTKEANDELQLFFDRYVKCIENGWEKTPRVRVSLLTYGDRNGPKPLLNLPFTEYPPRSTTYDKLHLTASKQLSTSPSEGGSLSYQADSLSAAPVDFVRVFDKPTTVLGYSKAKLWVSCNETDDLDIFLSLRKIDKNGKLLEHINIPWEALPDDVQKQEDVPNSNTIKFLGPSGVLRASHREQDPALSTDIVPHHPHTREQKIPPGTIIPVEIGIWPAGIHFESGEGLVLRVQGHLDQLVEFINHVEGKPENLNKGKHTIHVGGEFDSHLVLPIVPTDA
ncbi:Alpha/Beta hydrolase protein [Fusarium oxysporum]|nr:Alpha/Beta hydrolase protein [Fusarium oxysporum]